MCWRTSSFSSSSLSSSRTSFSYSSTLASSLPSSSSSPTNFRLSFFTLCYNFILPFPSPSVLPPSPLLHLFPPPPPPPFSTPPPPFSWIQRRLPPRSGRDAGGAFKPALYGSYGMQPGQAGPGSGHTQPCWFACPVSGGGPSVSTRLNPAASLPHPCVSHAISLCLPCDTSVSPLLHPCDSSATPQGLPCSFFATHPCLPCRFISLYPESLPIV